MCSQKHFDPQESHCPKKIGPQKFGSQKILAPQNFFFKCWVWKKNAAKRDSAGAVCNSGMGMLFLMHLRSSSVGLGREFEKILI